MGVWAGQHFGSPLKSGAVHHLRLLGVSASSKYVVVVAFIVVCCVGCDMAL